MATRSGGHTHSLDDLREGLGTTGQAVVRAETPTAARAVLEVPRVLRQRVTIAECNLGITLVPAVAGYQYQLIDAYAIAYGGAAGACTSVDLNGTVSAGAVVLVAFGQAALTQSTLVRAGSSGGVILANGASFVALDVATAITIKTVGSAMTTATGLDVVLVYLTASVTASVSPSLSPSSSPSLSPSISPSTSPSISPSVSPSISPSVSPSISPSLSPSVSPSISPSLSPSVSPSSSISPSVSPSSSISPSVSPSVSPSISPSPSF